jgi:hypothetical protein
MILIATLSCSIDRFTTTLREPVRILVRGRSAREYASISVRFLRVFARPSQAGEPDERARNRHARDESFPFTWHDGRRYQQEVYTSSTRPVTHQWNVIRVAAKRSYVLLHPVEHCYLVHQTVVGHAGSGVGWAINV